jgi:hypothetical protein
MSLVFRGIVEEYNNAGVRPSVFMDGAGSLQVYLCDSIIDEIEEDYGIDMQNDYDVNGGQFTQAYIMNKIAPAETLKHCLETETTL